MAVAVKQKAALLLIHPALLGAAKGIPPHPRSDKSSRSFGAGVLKT